MKIEQALSIPISVILEKMGHLPQCGNEPASLTYSSPYRRDGASKIVVNKETNTWQDPDLGEPQEGVQLIQLYLHSENEGSTREDALRWARNMIWSKELIVPISAPDYTEHDKRFKVRKVHPINENPLPQYIKKRRICPKLAGQFLKEASVFNSENGLTFYALSHRNESRGYEIRSPHIKASIGSQDITFIRGSIPKPPRIHIFKDIWDFMSVRSMDEFELEKDDAIILNSINNLRKGVAFIKNYGYRGAFTWLENSEISRKATNALAKFFKEHEALKHTNMSTLYAEFKSVNDWHIAKAGVQ